MQIPGDTSVIINSGKLGCTSERCFLAQISSLAFWLARHWKWCWKWTGGTGYWYTNDKLALLEVSTSITCPQQVARDFYGTFLVPTERQKAFLSQCAFSMAHALPMIQIDSFL